MEALIKLFYNIGHIFFIVTLILFFKSFFSDGSKLTNLSLTIEPPWVKRGQSALLQCHYDLNENPLYSVKWYRGNLEFYRYSPFEAPPQKIFPYTGIKVDVSTFFLKF